VRRQTTRAADFRRRQEALHSIPNGETMTKYLALILLAGIQLANAQSTPTTDETTLRQSIDVKLAPRSLLLSGGDVDSPSGKYLIDFPPPNECVQLGPIEASSRSFALYRAISQGGFTLKPASGGLTVWTIEEWNALTKGKWYAEFKKAHDAKCVKGNPK
jgi:hypothetical protein